MAQFQPASFIPKQPLTPVSSAPKKRKSKSIDLFMIIAVVIFVASLIGAGGAFVYERFTLSRIETKRNALEEVQKNLNPELIKEMVRYDTRIKKSAELLNSHVLLTPFFEVLDKSTVRSVQFTTLDILRAEDGNFVATLEGITTSYANIALQSDELGKVDHFLDPIVSDFKLNEDGQVQFKITLKIDSTLVSFRDDVSITTQ